MKTLLRFALVGWLLPGSQLGLAAAPADLDRLHPFIDPYTVAITELNLGKLDLPASTAALASILPEPQSMWAEPLEQVQRELGPWLEEFQKAGGDRLYVLLSLARLGSEPPVLLVAPPLGTADPDRLKAAFAKVNPPWPAQVMHGCAVTAPESILRDWPTGPAPAATERWRAAFDGSPAGVARIAFLPYADSDRVLSELLPTLPRQLGGGPSSVVSQGLQWAALTLNLPPQGSLDLTIQSASPEAANALRQAIEHGFNALDEIPELREQAAIWKALRPLLLPVAKDNRLLCRLEFAQLATVVRGLQPALEEARAKATRVVLMNQLKQIGLGLHIQAGDQGDRLPAHLVDNLKYLGDNPRLLLHPDDRSTFPSDFATQAREAKVAWIDSHTPFVYVRPEASLKEIKNPSTTVLVHERPKPGASSLVAVLFADGHVEILASEKLPDLLK